MLNAITCVWNEEDIIEAAVKHAFAQGCSNVFIVDNGSTDETVKRAKKAGAELAVSFKTRFFDERQKIAHLNAVVKYYNTQFQNRSVWWMFFDADEFPNINCELKISEFLKELDVEIKGLHGHMYNHIPSHFPYNLEGYHPADFMPVCRKSQATKIPLLRYDKGKPHLFSTGGAHDLDTGGETILMAKDIVDIHHFPARNPEYTLERLKRLLRRSEDGASRVDWMDKRSKLIYNAEKSPYHARYEQIRDEYKSNAGLALKTRELVYNFQNLKRWYNPFSENRYSGLQPVDAHICSAVLNFFMKKHEIALCKFNDALKVCRHKNLRLWIAVKIAECFSLTEPETAQSLLNQVYESGEPELCGYIDKNLATFLAGGKPGDVQSFAPPTVSVCLESYAAAFQIDPSGLYKAVDAIIEKMISAKKEDYAASSG
jgi:Glycosyltransferases involved in cell wall biogenesis